METDTVAIASPWHRGELALQESAGAVEQMASIGQRSIRRYLTQQHKDFYPLLPFIVLGSVDEQGDAWATLRAGRPGFVYATDDTHLAIEASRDPTDPADAGMSDGNAIGILGIELPTRRRNRANGTIERTSDDQFAIVIEQAYGNCAKYIQERRPTFARHPSQKPRIEVIQTNGLDARSRRFVEIADTFFVATYQETEGLGRQVDVSHRGGKPGFIRVDEDGVMTIPDFKGNKFFNTLGNILVNPRTGLVFVDLTSGDMLQLSGRSEVVLDAAETSRYPGAERLWRFRTERAVLRIDALPLRSSFDEGGLSPALSATGNWAPAAKRLPAPLIGHALPMIESPYHDQELAMQERSGRPDFAQSLAARIKPTLNEEASELLRSLPFLVAGTIDALGRPWASILCGPAGSIVVAETSMHLDMLAPSADPILENLLHCDDLGLIAIDPSRRLRYRINGKGRAEGHGIHFDVAQAYRNCPQFIHGRKASYEVARSIGEGNVRRMERLDEEAVDLISKSDTFYIATHGSGRPSNDHRLGADASHRGGNPGFVSVRDGGTALSFPDYIGNFMFNTIGNMTRYPRCGLLFVDYEKGNVLQITGTPEVDWDLERAVAMPGAQRMIDIQIDSAIWSGAVLPLRWTAVEPSPDLKRFRTVGSGGTEDVETFCDEETPGLIPMVVTKVVDEAENIRSFYLVPEQGEVLQHAPGQHLQVKLPVPGLRRSLLRHYSLSRYVSSPTDYRIGVRRAEANPAGSGSNFLHDHVRVGSRLLMSSPRGTFKLESSEKRPIALISAGVGITPMLSMLQALALEEASQPIWFIHGARCRADQAYASEVRRISDRLPNVKAHIAYSQPGPADFKGRDYDSAGRIDLSLITSLITRDACVYLCGPQEWMDDLRNGLHAWGISLDSIRFESFGSTQSSTRLTAMGVAGVSVRFVKQGVEAEWASTCESLLELSEENDLEIPFSCRSGDCGSCEQRLVQGEVVYPHEPTYPVRAGHVLTCCAQPISDVVIDDPLPP